MTKQLILILLLSLAAIFFKTELSQVLDGLIYLHNQIAVLLHVIFSDDDVGRLIQDMISLLIIPFVGGFLIALVFWLIKRAAMPNTMLAVWIVWLILLTTMIAQTGPSRQPIKTAQTSMPAAKANQTP